MYESFLYQPDQGLKTGVAVPDMEAAIKSEKSLLWLDFSDIDDTDIDLLTNIFNLHPLTVEDFIMPNVRPKIEQFPNYLFLVIFAPTSHGASPKGKAMIAELDCCLGKNFVITFPNQQIDPLTVCKERVRKQSPTIMHGADMLLYSILDSCIDAYMPKIGEFDNLVDSISDELFREPGQDTLKKIYNLKNEITYLRRTIGPQADVIGFIARGDFDLIAKSNAIYYRNLYDNILRLNDAVGNSRDIITGALEAYVSVVSNRLNEIMKTLTVITTFMMPLTLLASIYGMNFRYMPGLDHRLGYPILIVLMAAISAIMLVFFKRKKWL